MRPLLAAVAMLLISPSSALRPVQSHIMNRRALGGLVAVATTVAPPQRSLAAEPDVYAPLPGSLAGRTVVVTGANTGLGLETCARLAAAGADARRPRPRTRRAARAGERRDGPDRSSS